MDLLIVSKNVSSKGSGRRKEILQLKRWLLVPAPLDILLLRREECISNFRGHNPLFLDIATEARILVDRGGFLKELMEETRQYIRDHRLEKMAD